MTQGVISTITARWYSDQSSRALLQRKERDSGNWNINVLRFWKALKASILVARENTVLKSV